MWSRLVVLAVLAVAGLVPADAGARPRDWSVPCDAFRRTADGSWIVLRYVSMPAAGGKVNLLKGAVLYRGLFIKGQDFSQTLDHECRYWKSRRR